MNRLFTRLFGGNSNNQDVTAGARLEGLQLGGQIAHDYFDKMKNDGDIVKLSSLKLRDDYSLLVQNGFLSEILKFIRTGEIIQIEANDDDLFFIHKSYIGPLLQGYDGPLSTQLAVIWDDNIRYNVEIENEFDARKGWPYWKCIRPDSLLANLNIEKEKSVRWVKAGWRYIAASADEISPWYPIIQYCKSKGLVIVFRFINMSDEYEEGKNNPNSFYNSPCWVWGLKTPEEALDHPSEAFFYKDNLAGKTERTYSGGAFNTKNTPENHPLSPVYLEVTEDNFQEIITDWQNEFPDLYLVSS